MAVNAYLDHRWPSGTEHQQEGRDRHPFLQLWRQPDAVIGAGSSGRRGPCRAGPTLQDVTIMKVVDKTSPLLFDDCVTGNYLKKVDIIYDKPMGDNQEDYYKIHMENALITSIQHSGSNENPMESISFAFSKIKVSYNPEEDGA